MSPFGPRLQTPLSRAVSASAVLSGILHRVPMTYADIVVPSSRGQTSLSGGLKVGRVNGGIVVVPGHQQRRCFHCAHEDVLALSRWAIVWVGAVGYVGTGSGEGWKEE